MEVYHRDIRNIKVATWLLIWGRSLSMCFLGCWPSHPRKCVSFWSCLGVIVWEPKNWNISDQILHRYIWHFLTLPSRNKSCSIKTSKPSLFFVKTSGGFCILATQSFFKIVIFATKVVFCSTIITTGLLGLFHNQRRRQICYSINMLSWNVSVTHDTRLQIEVLIEFPPWYKSYKTINIRQWWYG